MAFPARSLNLLQAVLFVNKWQPRSINNCFLLACKTLRHSLAVILVIIILTPPTASARIGGDSSLSSKQQKQLGELIDKGAFILSKDGKVIASHRADLALIPASISKFVTALAAFDQLGEDYRFKTDFFVNDRQDLFIKGYGDPFLVSEEIERIVRSLKKAGVEQVNRIYIDDSSYRLKSRADGAGHSLNPYDVSCGGLVVNFNTINIVVDKDNTVSSGEAQTPQLPIMTRLGKNLKPGEYRINISSDPDNVLLLTGQLFRAFLDKDGISGSGPISRRKAPASKPLLSHSSSKKMLELIEGLMLYSNNFIANQIFLATGADRYGFPATWLKARRAMQDFAAKDKELSKMNIKLVEGSGLSRNNRLTAGAMLRVLELFKPHADLLPEKDGVMIKSGTLTGVYSYAGYLPTTAGLNSFVVILNQQQNHRDEILNILKKIHSKVN
jgi:D-alanyl-D-alanine carboxypeptidase/D-alanyl-D-alanine-endopeptidase (penicillin-binding protein 4)